jgi:hypothetical protein
MKRTLLTATVLAAIAGGGFALAQAPATNAKAPKATATEQTGAALTGCPMGGGMMGGGPMGGGPMGGGMMGGGMMGGGPMGGGMMGGGMMGGGPMAGGMCPMVMGAANTKVDVKKIEKGVTITLTSSDAPTVARLQKMAEAMRLMHEAMAQ